MISTRWLLWCYFFIFALSSWGDVTPTPTVPSSQETLFIDLPGLPLEAKPLELVLLPAGTFLMGEPNNTTDNVPYPVTIPQDFYMGKYEVTQAQWETLMGDNPFSNNPYRPRGVNIPVEVQVWDVCNDFISRLNRLGKGYFRFPTEAEWEYACRAGTTSRFYWGESVEPTETSKYGKFLDDTTSLGNEVGLRLPNPWGLHDMNGGVSEWCLDFFHPLSSPAAVVDPVVLEPNWNSSHSIRGEGYGINPVGSYFRTGDISQGLFILRKIGLRLVMVPNAPQGTPTPTFTPTYTPIPPTPTYTPTPTNTPIPPFVPNDQEFTLDIYPDQHEPLSFVRIDAQEGTVGPVEKTNYRMSLYYAAINQTGEVFFHNGKTLILRAGGTQILALSDYDYTQWFSPIQLDSSGRWVAIRMYPPAIQIYDLQTDSLIGRMELSHNVSYIQASQNLDTFAINRMEFGSGFDSSSLMVFNWDGIKFSEPIQIYQESDKYISSSEPLISSSGNRIFFSTHRYSTKTQHFHCFDRTPTGWVKNELRGFLVLPSNSYAYLYDLANDGKTLLARWRMGEGLALVHETDAGWSEPEFIGSPPNTYFHQVEISEDGNVVACWEIKEPYNTIYIYMKTKSGQWIEHVNNNPGGIGLSGIRLSKDGKRLYWAPALMLLGIDQNEWMLH